MSEQIGILTTLCINSPFFSLGFKSSSHLHVKLSAIVLYLTLVILLKLEKEIISINLID